MLNFLFDQYGYYPKKIVDNEFFADGWKFKLCQTDMPDDKLNEVDRYVVNVRNLFNGKGPYIIKTRQGNISSFYKQTKYVLMCVWDCYFEIEDLNKFHYLFKEEKKVDLSQLLDTWRERMLSSESNLMNSLRTDSVYYQNNLEISLFCLGMAQNAIQYLSELILDYGNEISGVCLSHKRLTGLDSYNFLMPFNYIIDHPIRDYVLLYKSEVITFSDLDYLITRYYYVDVKVASLLMCRMLYPEKVFDFLDESYMEKNINFKIEYNIEKELSKTKKIYDYLRVKCGIRPIEWLEF